LEAGVRRFVHFSTISVYGDDSRLTGTLDETMPPTPLKGSDYGESKAASEQTVLEVAKRGLNAAIFRPARVFGPFSGIFIVNPLSAIAERRFRWLGDPDVPCDMVYVDNLAHAVVLALESPDKNVRGEVFNVSDGDLMAWSEFYGHLTRELGLDLSAALVDGPTERDNGRSGSGLVGAVRRVVGSPEFRAFGRRVLDTDPLGTFPRWALNRFPGVERAVRKMVGADGSLPIYRREPAIRGNVAQMGSAGAVASIAKAQRLLNYSPIVPRDRALELTLMWARHARIVRK
jgi:nucleoside-diphosphate-sugar epimerase